MHEILVTEYQSSRSHFKSNYIHLVNRLVAFDLIFMGPSPLLFLYNLHVLVVEFLHGFIDLFVFMEQILFGLLLLLARIVPFTRRFFDWLRIRKRELIQIIFGFRVSRHLLNLCILIVYKILLILIYISLLFRNLLNGLLILLLLILGLHGGLVF